MCICTYIVQFVYQVCLCWFGNPYTIITYILLTLPTSYSKESQKRTLFCPPFWRSRNSRPHPDPHNPDRGRRSTSWPPRSCLRLLPPPSPSAPLPATSSAFLSLSLLSATLVSYRQLLSSFSLSLSVSLLEGGTRCAVCTVGESDHDCWALTPPLVSYSNKGGFKFLIIFRFFSSTVRYNFSKGFYLRYFVYRMECVKCHLRV